MVKIYANSVERGTRSINVVPSNLREEVRAIVIADGYDFDEDGFAHKKVEDNNEADI